MRERVVMGDEAPERCETEKEHDEDGGHPPVAVWQHSTMSTCVQPLTTTETTAYRQSGRSKVFNFHIQAKKFPLCVESFPQTGREQTEMRAIMSYPTSTMTSFVLDSQVVPS